MKNRTKAMTALLSFVFMAIMLFSFTACGNEWDNAINKTIKELSADNANYLMSTTCLYGVGTPQEYGYKEKLYVDSGKYYSVRSDLDGKNEKQEDVRYGAYPLIREDYNNDAIYQSMLLGSIIGKSDYFTAEEGKYTLSDDKKEAIAKCLLKFSNMDIVNDMYYVISGGKVTGFYTLLDRSSVKDTTPIVPMSISLTFEYGTVKI